MAIKKSEGFVYTANKFKITRGQDTQLIVHVFNPDFSPISLLAYSSCETLFKKEDGSVLTIPNHLHTVVNVEPGIFRLALSSSDTSQLKVGADQTIEVAVSSTAYGQTTKKLIQIEGALTVIKSMSES